LTFDAETLASLAEIQKVTVTVTSGARHFTINVEANELEVPEDVVTCRWDDDGYKPFIAFDEALGRTVSIIDSEEEETKPKQGTKSKHLRE